MKIEEIRDIVRVIRNNEFLMDSPFDFEKLVTEDSKVGKFYKILLEPSIIEDTEVVAKLYHEGDTFNKYKSLKSYFLSRTLNNTIFFDLARSGKSEHIQAIYKSYKYLFIVRVFLALGSRSGAINLAKKTMRLAAKHELYSVTVDLLGELMTDALRLGKEKEFLKYSKISDRHKTLLLYETKIVALQQQIAIHFTRSLFINQTLRSDIHKAMLEAKRMLDKADTNLGRISYYRLLYVYLQLKGEPIKSIEACDAAITYMQSKPHLSPPSRFAEFALYKLENYILVRDYDCGKEAILFCEMHINKGMNLWFSLKEYEFLLLMQTTRFEEADSIYKEVLAHERYHSLSLHLQERWQIFGLHIQYVMRSNSAQSDVPFPPHFRKSSLFRNRDFQLRLVDSPTYKKDKRGYNVALLTLNILVTLEENKLDLLLLQEEALSSYRFKYLNEKHCRQSFILFKLIRLVTKNDFDLVRIEKKARAFEKELDLRKLEAGEIFECIQILPPQWVWGRIKTILANRKKNN